MKTYEDLDELERALTEMRDIVQKEQFARGHWITEDKDEWQRKRVSRTKALLRALSEYL